MKKTIYVISTMFYPSIGGVENHIYFLSKVMIKNGFDVKVLKPVLGEKSEVYDLDGIEVHNIGIGSRKEKDRYEKYKENSKGSKLGFLYGYLRKNLYNRFYNEIYEYIENDISKSNINQFVIHQHDFISSIRLSKKLSKKYKVIFTNHTGEFLFIKKLPFSNIIIKLLTNHFNYIIAPSDELARFDGIRDINTFKYIPNGVDMELFKPSSKESNSDLKKIYEIKDDKIIILCPRRWAPTKGIIYLVKAIKILSDSNVRENVEFLFVGNEYSDYAEYSSEINEYIHKHNLQDMCSMMGNINSEQMANIMKCSDIVVLPSLMEAVSLSALEAMASAKVVISTNVGGFPQIITNNENGIMVDAKNERQLADELLRVINDFDKFKEMGENAFKFVEGKYSWDNIGNETMRIYNEYINEIGGK